MLNFEFKAITPDMAKQMLLQNTDNRKVNPRVVDRYARDILSGMWKENTAEFIKISSNGKILDGQHRLHAIVKSGETLNLHVANGVEESVFDVLDTGLIRSANDIFTISKAPNASILPSIIQLDYNIKRGRLKGRTNILTNQGAIDLYNEQPEEWQKVVKKSHNYYNHFSKVLSKTFIGGFYKSFLDIAGEEITTDFFDQLCIGKSFTNETIIWLRKRLIEEKISKLKLPMVVKYSLVIKTWNAYRKGKNLRSIKISDEIEKIL